MAEESKKKTKDSPPRDDVGEQALHELMGPPPTSSSPSPAPAVDVDHRAFRRAAGIAVLGAYVTRQGTLGNSREERDVFARMIWDYADAFCAAEDAGPLPERQPDGLLEETPPPRPSAGRRRPAHPSDEFAVIDGERIRRGFVSYEEAEFYATARPGARIKQVSGPEQLVADPDAV